MISKEAIEAAKRIKSKSKACGDPKRLSVLYAAEISEIIQETVVAPLEKRIEELEQTIQDLRDCLKDRADAMAQDAEIAIGRERRIAELEAENKRLKGAIQFHCRREEED